MHFTLMCIVILFSPACRHTGERHVDLFACIIDVVKDVYHSKYKHYLTLLTHLFQLNVPGLLRNVSPDNKVKQLLDKICCQTDNYRLIAITVSLLYMWTRRGGWLTCIFVRQLLSLK